MSLLKKGGVWKGLGLALAIPFLLVAAVFLGDVAGGFLDHYFGTAPWLGLAGVIAGVVAGFLAVYRLALRLK